MSHPTYECTRCGNPNPILGQCDCEWQELRGEPRKLTNNVELEIALGRAQQERDDERAHRLRLAKMLADESARCARLGQRLDEEARERERWTARVKLLEARIEAARWELGGQQ